MSEIILSTSSLVLIFIVLLLIVQSVAISKGVLIPERYSENKRRMAGIVVGMVPVSGGLLEGEMGLVVFGIALGFIAYKRKAWYKFK